MTCYFVLGILIAKKKDIFPCGGKLGRFWRLLIRGTLRRAPITAEGGLAFAGNETNIPKMFENFLYPRGWQEIKITGDLLQNEYRGTIGGDFFKAPFEERSIKEGATIFILIL